MDEEDFDGETHPLPDDLKFKDLVNMSLELSEKMGEHLDGQEQTLAVCSLILLLKKGMKMFTLYILYLVKGKVKQKQQIVLIH